VTVWNEVGPVKACLAESLDFLFSIRGLPACTEMATKARRRKSEANRDQSEAAMSISGIK